MPQTAPKLRLVEAPSTGYARKAWISHVIETAPDEVGGTELAVLKELADLVDDATGWVEVSYDKLARRTRFSLKTVRRAVKVLAAAGLVEPELIRGQGRDRLRYRFPAMHAFLAVRKARRDGGQADQGQIDRGQTARPTLVTVAAEPDPPPAPPPENQKPRIQAKRAGARAREGFHLGVGKGKQRHRPAAHGLPTARGGRRHGDRGQVVWKPAGAAQAAACRPA